MQQVEEKNLRIDELENDLKEAHESTTPSYGGSKRFLESENLRLIVKNEELQKQINDLKQAASFQRLVSPVKDQRVLEVKRHSVQPAVKMQSPTKRSKIADLDLDDDSQCNTQ